MVIALDRRPLPQEILDHFFSQPFFTCLKFSLVKGFDNISKERIMKIHRLQHCDNHKLTPLK